MNPRVVNLRELVAVQEASIISRGLLRTPSGNLTLFAFDAGQELSEHTAPFDAWVMGLEGEGEITIGGKPHRVGEGQALHLPAGVPHAVKALTPFKMLLVMFRTPS